MVTKKDIINSFIELSKQYPEKRITRDFFVQNTNIRYSDVVEHFNSFTDMLRDIENDLKDITKRSNNEFVINNTNHKRFIVTSVVEGAPINENFLSALKGYCKINDAQLVILWMKGTKKNDSFLLATLHSLKPYLATNFRFSEKLRAMDFQLSPQQMNPLMGLDRYGQKESSLIIAHTKQFMNSIPRPKGNIPHTIWSTGTISEPFYSSTRVGSIASQDNKLGALVVEIGKPDRFWIRPVQWINNQFVDLGIAYKPNMKTCKVKTKAMILGDLHIGEEDTESLNTSIEQINYFNPENTFIHDLCSLNSINHHEKNQYLARASRKFFANMNLSAEMEYLANKMASIARQTKSTNTQFKIVHSNHDNFMDKWLNDGEFIKDKSNAELGAHCFIYSLQGKNPLEELVNQRGEDPQMMKKFEFLQEDQQYLVEGFDCGSHGHNGPNGASGTATNFARTHMKAVIGHSHSPKIEFDTYQVGTNSKLDLGYNKGSSSWLHANCVIYEGGYIQMLTFIDKQWKI